jgi:acetyltransferase-like isoleucine patch superfamily enzyme
MIKNILDYIVKKRNGKHSLSTNIPPKHLFELFFRKILCHLRTYKLLFRFRIPGLFFIGSNVTFEGISNISWGRWVQVGMGTRLSAYGVGKLSIGDNVTLGSYSSFVVSYSLTQLGEFIIIGSNVGMGDFAHIGGGGGVVIGDDTIVGPYLSCHPSNHIYLKLNQLIRHQGVTRQGITIGRNCWIGAKVTILDGVTIGDNCIIAAGSVVDKNIEPNTVAAGVPARVVKSRE